MSVKEAAIEKLKALLGSDRVFTSDAVRHQHGHGEGIPNLGLPDVVVYPATTEEVAEVARICFEAKLPMIPFGAGSSVEGQLVALKGGVSIDLTRMDKIIEVSPGSMDCRVEAGVTRETLNSELRATGLFFPVDPGANATLGGMAATRASGTNAVRYGTMRENVLGLTVVTPDGRIIRTGTRARKSSAGYDLTRVYVGSEGTLGIITEIQLRLSAIPEGSATAVAQFDELQEAVDVVTMALQAGITPARIELLDDVQMGACISYSKLDQFEVRHTVLLEFQGTQKSANEDAEYMGSLMAESGATSFRIIESVEEKAAIWKMRHNAFYAGLALRPGAVAIGTDACVPIEMLAACMMETKADLENTDLVAPIAGHVGDGNFHLCILFDPESEEEREAAEGLATRISHRAIAMGGTCTGEHGVGMHKTIHMYREHGDAVEIMWAIKNALDPYGLMNPGKVLPEDKNFGAHEAPASAA